VDIAVAPVSRQQQHAVMSAKKGSAQSELRSTAIHEAGHAVIGRVLGLSCGSVTIIANEAEGEAGHAIIHDPWKTSSDWDQRLMEQVERGLMPSKCHDSRSAFRGTILARMAGAEAENVIVGACQGGDGFDQYEIGMMAESSDTGFTEAEWERYEPRMRRQTRRLVRKHRAKIERVAAALLKHRTLQPADVDAAMVDESGA
jgi:ATP-dependent Zn protease